MQLFFLGFFILIKCLFIYYTGRQLRRVLQAVPIKCLHTIRWKCMHDCFLLNENLKNPKFQTVIRCYIFLAWGILFHKNPTFWSENIICSVSTRGEQPVTYMWCKESQVMESGYYWRPHITYFLHIIISVKGILWVCRWSPPSLRIFPHTCWFFLHKCISNHETKQASKWYKL